MKRVKAWHPTAPTLRDTPGPTRVVTDQDNEVERHPLGFAPPRRTPVEREPLLWEGDQA